MRTGTTWSEPVYVKAFDTNVEDRLGWSVAVSGTHVVVGANREDSDATGANGEPFNENARQSGAAYVFRYDGVTWSQHAYLKASNTEQDDLFASSVGVSGDTIVVGASWERSAATGINGDQNDNASFLAGAAYILSGLEAAAPTPTETPAITATSSATETAGPTPTDTATPIEITPILSSNTATPTSIATESATPTTFPAVESIFLPLLHSMP